MTASDIGDGVVTLLQAASLSQPLTVERRFTLPTKVEGILPETFYAWVVINAAGREMSAVARGRIEKRTRIDIGVVKKLTDRTSTTEIDEALVLAEQIADLFSPKVLVDSARWQATDQNPVVSPQHIDEFGVFLSLISVTFRHWETI
jgi:hypothetical protein